ncbi:type I polyketide synthase [Actinomadura kijaniata]|uniref:type I polyketide synthase n=1 Tax=Actinomadura kijaniata TaxID=46161 RepID=UPI0008367F52|nr:type I polyketide synthase [Actinomadura kijaniata]
MNHDDRLDPDSAIAVTGLACRFPGAPDADAFWRMLVEGREGLTRLTDDRLAERGVPRRLRRDPAYVPVAGLIDGQDAFDPRPFGLADAEAALMDPQHRLFLECAWRALEQAGHGGGRGAGAVGVFAGAAQSAYLAGNLADRWDPTGGGADPAGSLQTAIATQTDYLPLQTAYRLDLTGPAVAVNTTCSTSLVAVHLAAQSLLNGECDTALAGGVSLIVPQGRGYLAMADGIYSRDGRIRPFSARGTGIVYTQGVGVVALRRLRDALDDGDPVLAVVLGSAVNNDGAAKAGFTAPSLQGQAAVIAEAHAVAGVEPRGIGYVEAHGTATRIGDPIEVAALRRVFGDTGPAWCGLGSVKSNIGHANSAAGIASFIKTVLAVRHGTLPASLHASPVNELLGLDGSPFEVVTETRPWDGPPLAGVSSFGIGGTNAHVVVGPPPDRPASPPDPRPHPIVLSAHTPEALRATAADLAEAVDTGLGTGPADLAYTLQTGREHLPHRLAVVADGGSLASALREAAPTAPVSTSPRVVLAFPGGGSARPGMGAGLYAAEPVFADCVDECAELFAGLLSLDIRAVVTGDAGPDAAHGPVHGLPALFAVSLATARLLGSWGIAPHAVLGHSLGEYTAAVVAGALPTAEAARLIAVRSTLMAETAGDGAMLAVPLPERDTRAVLDRHPGVGLAAVNGPGSCVVSGPRADVNALESELRAAGLAPTRLRFDGAAHSRLVEPALPRMREAAEGVKATAPAVPLISTVTGAAAGDELATAEHWARQLRRTVRFSAALRTAVEGPDGVPVVLVQAGPGAALATLARGHGLPALREALGTFAVDDPYDDLSAVRAAAGRLWAHGVDVDFPAMHRTGRRRVAAPGYAFQRRRLWIDPPDRSAVHATDGEPPDETEPLQVPVWRQVTPLDPAARLRGRWLVAGRHAPDTDEIRAALERAGAEAVPLGEADAGTWDGVVTLAHGDDVTPEILLYARLAEVVAAGEPPAVLLHVTRSAQRVESADRPDPVAAASQALPRVLAQERPGLRWRTLDLDDRTDLAPAVLTELGDAFGSGAESGTEIALRGGTRWIRGVRPWRPAPRDPGIRRGDLALIIGGLGDVGLTTAAHLARRGMRVVVTSRSAPPAGGDRARWLRALADEGLDIEVRQVDAADAEATAALLADLAERAPLALVVHAAGVVATADLSPLRQVTDEHVTGHVHAKIEGALALRAAVEGLPDDRRPRAAVLMSSAGTLVGGVGMGPYCAANRYLDAFAESLSTDGPADRSTRWTSVVWDAWKVGPLGGEREVRLAYALDAATGMAALDRILAVPNVPPVVAVSITDLRERMPAASYTPPRPTEEGDRSTELTDAQRTVADLWSDVLGVPVTSPDADFFALGGHSLLATRMLTALRGACGVELRLRDLFDRPTVAGLAELLDRPGAGEPPPATRAPGGGAAEDGTFPMTRVQHAYWVGRGGGYALGDIACHFYLEYDCDGLDVARYEAAWRQVIARHPMLRTIVTGEGRLRTLDHVPPYRIRVHDLAEVSEDVRAERLRRLRERVSRDPGPPDRWPLVQIRAARLPEGRVRLFIGVDVLVCDAGSYWIIDREVRHFYENPGVPLPEPGVDFAACVRAAETARDGDDRRRAAAYWRDRLDTVPGPPPLPVSDPQGPPRFARRTARLGATEWDRLRAEAARRGTTPTAVLLTAYAEALAEWSGGRHFAVTLTLFDRPPLHPDVDAVVGDFTSLLVHEADRRRPGSFAEHVRATHERLFSDLDHRAYSALDLFAESAARTGRVASVPVVFTSALGLEDLVGGEPDLQWVGEQVYALSQTPQTWLDHQVLVQRGELLVQWDFVEDVLPADEVDRVFARYAARLRRLATDPDAWDERPPAATPSGDAPTWNAPTWNAPTWNAPTWNAPTWNAPSRDAPTPSAPTPSAPTPSAPSRGAPSRDVPSRGAPTRETVTPNAITEDVLVPLRDGTAGGGRTLYLLHPSGGDVMCYAELSRLLDERFSVVAVTDPGLVGGDAPDALADLARGYGELLRSRTPGPYLLGGWSMGGSLGQEVACHLRDAGERVDLLLMLDSNDPTHITPIEAADADAEAMARLLGAFEAYRNVDLGVGAPRRRADLLALPADRRYAEVAARLREHGLMGRRDDVRDRVAVFARHLRGLAGHAPQRLGDDRTRTLLVRADRPASRNSGIGMGVDDTPPGLPDLGWGRHLAAPPDVHGVDADHYGLLRPPVVSRVAELINQVLARL